MCQVEIWVSGWSLEESTQYLSYECSLLDKVLHFIKKMSGFQSVVTNTMIRQLSLRGCKLWDQFNLF